ncbi:hypothetical protein [Chryseobacterium potabilaquae]|uniref:Uncharacterized protein n=1 Tax=Chryseobacterium potabilaquae TaxID=2675057 RepID=A0A6N4XAR6_9FLAO|nr:hypothetical protein [Chryseobacterium potabilaquae]CAA7196805.1 hypothetical protein CHRY9293_02877 [Chryseobacterium potabilaquae]
MSKIDFLDRFLNYIKDNNGYSITKDEIKGFNKEEKDLMAPAIKKFVDDGYVYSVQSSSPSLKSYKISFEGIIEIDSAPKFIFKRKPYKYKEFLKKL